MHGYRIPQFFLETSQKGFFQADHWTPRDIPVCSSERAVGGECPSWVPILLDDWGFSGKDEMKECPLNHEGKSGCDNKGYFNLVNKSYVAESKLAGTWGDTPASELADATVISPGEVVPLLGEADIERIVFDGPSRVIDVGVRVQSEEQVIRGIYGRVTTLLPGEACLFCRERISPRIGSGSATSRAGSASRTIPP